MEAATFTIHGQSILDLEHLARTISKTEKGGTEDRELVAINIGMRGSYPELFATYHKPDGSPVVMSTRIPTTQTA